MTTATATTAELSVRPRGALHISLWVAQVALGAMFAFGGFLKLTTPVADLATKMPWVTALPEPLLRFIGFAELAGALGLVFPSLTRIAPRLTPLAAAGLATIMLLAAGFHVMRGEPGLVINSLLFAIAAFIAWGRMKRPIPPRSTRSS